MGGKRKGPDLNSPDRKSPDRPKRRLTPEDQRLWQHVAGQIKPLSGRDRLYSQMADLLREEAAEEAAHQSPPGKRRPGAGGPSLPVPPPAVPPAAPRPQPELTHGSRAGVDRRRAERLSRGKLPIEATLDLHGLRQAEAHRRLEHFLVDSQAAGRRCVLIVTGKGVHKEEGGVLRANVPRWLNEAPNRARVLSFDYAQQKHGGTGALYVLLRRRR